ncbi:MAG: NAD(P)H-dependent oxidoreductase [Lentisphaeria bacterium]|nr:NAD(P)H-dependent oxidoreductase [Lentisphaeria bacterium]NQZ69503.1 NAD(P)H-dependent oxidoreductase [Lentisphaeria bacterium]
MKLIAFAASSSTKSINKKLVTYAAGLVDGAEVEILDINDYEIPLFSQDREEELGQPELAKAFRAKFESCDAIIISFAEHNGSYTAAYKNLFDWCSRIDRNVYQDKPMVLLSASPGGGGGANVLAMAMKSMPYFGGEIKGSFSLAKFHANFDMVENKISDSELDAELKKAVDSLKT